MPRTNTTTTETTSYVYLKAWNRMLHSPIDYNVDTARREKAPAKAIYRKAEGGWATVDEVTATDTRDVLYRIVEDLRRKGE